MSARISIVTVSYRTGPVLLDALAAMLDDPAVHEVVLVDNGNPEPARRALADFARHRPRLRLLQGHGNTGFARACNYGAALATGDHVFFLNPDALPDKGAASRLAEALAGRPVPSVAGARIVNPDGAEQRGGRRGALTFASAITAFTPLHRLRGVRGLHWEGEPLPQEPAEVPTVSGAAMMLRRADIGALGGFDPGYFLHVEDIALCRAVRDAGGTVLFVPGARVVHRGSTSDAARLTVEAHKLRGFLRYFWTGGGPGAKIGTVIGAPFMAAAILGRAALLSLRGR